MNGKEKTVLEVVANDVSWIKNKLISHDGTFFKISDKLNCHDRKITEISTLLKERSNVKVRQTQLGWKKLTFFAGTAITIILALVLHFI